MRPIRVLICGSRTFSGHIKIRETGKVIKAYDLLEHIIDKYYGDQVEKKEIVIVHGGASGADSLADLYAKKHGLSENYIKVFRPYWKRMGKAAGPYRNTLMAEFADVGLAFWDFKSTGTKDMLDKMRARKKKIRVIGGWLWLDVQPVMKRKVRKSASSNNNKNGKTPTSRNKGNFQGNKGRSKGTKKYKRSGKKS